MELGPLLPRLTPITTSTLLHVGFRELISRLQRPEMIGLAGLQVELWAFL